MRRIVRRPRAKQDLGEIYDWIAESSVSNASSYIKRLVSVMERLSEMPGMGSKRLPAYPSIRAFPVGNHLIFYVETDAGIEIIRVIHGAQDWQEVEYLRFLEELVLLHNKALDMVEDGGVLVSLGHGHFLGKWGGRPT
jgi:toxin ParE1/3/4